MTRCNNNYLVPRYVVGPTKSEKKNGDIDGIFYKIHWGDISSYNVEIK